MTEGSERLRGRGYVPVSPGGAELYVSTYGEADRGARVVVCPPLGEEQGFARSPLHALARGLAAAGHYVVVYDPRGHGDSSGAFRDVTLEGLTADLAVVARGADLLVGVRFGAAVIAHALALGLVSPARIVLVAPVLRGEAYVRDLLRSHVATQIAAHGESRRSSDDLRSQIAAGAALDLDGHPISARLFTAIEPLDALSSLVEAGASVDVLRPERRAGSSADVDELVKRRPGTTVRDVAFPCFWWEDRRRVVGAMPELEAALVDVAGAMSPGLARPAARLERTRLESGAEERAVQVSFDGGSLAGVLHVPAQAGGFARAVLMPPAGTRDRSGPGRLYVRLARSLCRRGHHVLRYDGAGSGESEGPALPDDRRAAYRLVQEGMRVDEVRAAATFLKRASGGRPVFVVGLCGAVFHGAWLASAAPELFDGLVGLGAPPRMVGPAEGLSAEAAAMDAAPSTRSARRQWGRRYLRRATDPAAWVRLVSGKTDYGSLFRALSALMPASPPTRAGRTPAGDRAHRAETGVDELSARALSRLARLDDGVHVPTWERLVRARRRGAPISLLWGANDMAAYVFQDLLLEPVPELGSLLSIATVKDANHECASEAAFARLEALVLEGLAAGRPARRSSLAPPSSRA